MPVTRSNVVLVARVDDPVRLLSLTTYSTIVSVEHEDNEPLPAVVEMALELAPPVKEWEQF